MINNDGVDYNDNNDNYDNLMMIIIMLGWGW